MKQAKTTKKVGERSRMRLSKEQREDEMRLNLINQYLPECMFTVILVYFIIKNLLAMKEMEEKVKS